MVPGVTTSSKNAVPSSYNRRAHHAGSWYESDPHALDQLLTSFLNDAQQSQQNNNNNNNNTSIDQQNQPIRALIVPHAGYRYSGPTAAYAYLHLKQYLIQSHHQLLHPNKPDSTIPTVTFIVLHPSHHCYLDGCAVSGATCIETPLNNLLINQDLRDQLVQTGEFSIMDRTTDEKEHSGEMQYPFISKMIQEYKSFIGTNHTFLQIRILPIMVGALTTSQEAQYGNLLSSILSQPLVCTILSSDFCHWGHRFHFSPLPTLPNQEIYQYIEWLDRTGMNHISMQEPGAFASYLKQYNNTICGRHPIGVWLNAISVMKDQQSLKVKFVHYEQSSRVRSAYESSVSYASAVATLQS